MLNRSILIGRLTKDPDLKYTASGIACSQFTLAVDRPVQKDKEKEADFIPVVVWRQAAESVANYCRKGKLVAVEGRIQVRNYENNEGRRIYVTEVIADNVRFLEKAERSESGGGGSKSNKDPFAGDSTPIDISDSDLPF